MHNDQGLPPRAGSEYDSDLHPYGADRYAPTDPRAFAARLDLITASEYKDALRACADMDDLDDLRACIALMDLDDLRACIAMMDLFVPRIAAAPRRLAEYDACTLKAEMRAVRRAFDLRDEMWRAMYDLKTEMRRAKYDPKADKEARELKAQEERLRALDEELELWEAEDHIAFDAASRIQADKNEARELEAQERLCAQDKDNAQYLEQENDGLRIQAETKREVDTVAAAESAMGVLCEREMDVGAAEPEPGVREMDTTASAKIFAVAPQDLYISKSTAADAPTGSTLNEPESRAFTAGPCPHAFGAKNVNLTVYSRAKVKGAPLARIRIDDEVYT